MGVRLTHSKGPAAKVIRSHHVTQTADGTKDGRGETDVKQTPVATGPVGLQNTTATQGDKATHRLTL